MDKERKMVMSCLLLAASSSLVFGGEWTASVVKELDALISSCVVIPCSFTHPNDKQPTSKIRASWHLKSDRNQRVYFEDQTQVMDKFKGRTKLLGQLGQDNCTLEISNIHDHDNGPFCFRVELVDVAPKEKFSFVEDCARLNMLPDAPKPELTHPKKATQDRPYTLTCSVTHDCPSHAPKLKWSRGTADDVSEVHRKLPAGLWEVQSTLTFILGEKDDHSEITCTAEFHGGKTSSSAMTLYIKRYIFNSSWTWQVHMPRNIKGLLGSCLVIPCHFDYYQYPPQRPDRVVWYQYASRGYPLVYDRNCPYDVIDMFRGRTSRPYTPSWRKDCSLKINPVKWSDHRQMIYTWIDPENVGRGTYRFFDTTVTIEVVGKPEEPKIMIYGNAKVGQSVTVECSVYHTCPTNQPTLSFNIQLQGSSSSQHPMSDGKYKTSLRGTLNIDRHLQTVECTATHLGGQNTTVSKLLNAECSFSPLTIRPPSTNEFLEGQASTVTCTVWYTCAKDLPTLRWNYDSMPASTETRKTRTAQWTTVSTLSFTASGNDDGRSLRCYAQFTGGQTADASITLRVKRYIFNSSWTWQVHMPRHIKGLLGSCLVIPCHFDYYQYPPQRPDRVVWYQYASSGYPLVYDEKYPYNVIDMFWRRTSRPYTPSWRKDCSLKINPVKWSDHRQKIYTWIDPENVGRGTYRFFDTTVTIEVVGKPEEPKIMIYDNAKVGQSVTVECSVYHTCPTNQPTLSFNIQLQESSSSQHPVSDGKYKTSLRGKLNIDRHLQTVECTATHLGGQNTTVSKLLNAECPYQEIKMTEKPSEATEGVAKSVICSVSYKCKKNTPTIAWNYKDMKSSLSTKKISTDTYNTVSNLTFIGSLGDNGKPLTCTAQFMTGETSDSATISIKKYEKPVEETDPHESDTSHILAADVPFRFSALADSCVVIPCSFQYEEDVPLTRGIWSKKAGGIVYHNGRSQVLDHFKDRTRLLGDLNEGNCS
ncbi:Myelin-associated glycoprotein, partial [Nibea albiflora]